MIVCMNIMWRCNASRYCHIKEKEEVSCILSFAWTCNYFMTKTPSKIKALPVLHSWSPSEASLFTKSEKRSRRAGNCFVSLHIQHKTVTSGCEIRLYIVCLKGSLFWPPKHPRWKLIFAVSVNKDKNNSFKLDVLLSKENFGNRSQFTCETSCLFEILFTCCHVDINCPVSMMYSEDRLWIERMLTVDPSLMFECSKSLYNSWIMVSFSTFWIEVPFFILVNETGKMKKKKSMWSSGINTELQCCQTLQLTSEAEGRMKVRGEKKNRKKGSISSKAFVTASVVSQCEIHWAVNTLSVLRNILCNIHQQRGIMFAHNRGGRIVG